MDILRKSFGAALLLLLVCASASSNAELYLVDVAEVVKKETPGIFSETLKNPDFWRRAAEGLGSSLKGTKAGDYIQKGVDKLDEWCKPTGRAPASRPPEESYSRYSGYSGYGYSEPSYASDNGLQTESPASLPTGDGDALVAVCVLVLALVLLIALVRNGKAVLSFLWAVVLYVLKDAWADLSRLLPKMPKTVVCGKVKMGIWFGRDAVVVKVRLLGEPPQGDAYVGLHWVAENSSEDHVVLDKRAEKVGGRRYQVRFELPELENMPLCADKLMPLVFISPDGDWGKAEFRTNHNDALECGLCIPAYAVKLAVVKNRERRRRGISSWRMAITFPLEELWTSAASRLCPKIPGTVIRGKVKLGVWFCGGGVVAKVSSAGEPPQGDVYVGLHWTADCSSDEHPVVEKKAAKVGGRRYRADFELAEFGDMPLCADKILPLAYFASAGGPDMAPLRTESDDVRNAGVAITAFEVKMACLKQMRRTRNDSALVRSEVKDAL